MPVAEQLQRASLVALVFQFHDVKRRSPMGRSFLVAQRLPRLALITTNAILISTGSGQLDDKR